MEIKIKCQNSKVNIVEASEAPGFAVIALQPVILNSSDRKEIDDAKLNRVSEQRSFF